MNDEQLVAWLAQHGGEVGRSDNEVEIDDPADTGPKMQGESRRKIKQIDSTTITAKDGATIKLRRIPGGGAQVGPDPGQPGTTGQRTPTYQEIERTPPKPLPASQQPRNPTEQAADANAAELQRQRERNAALSKDQDPAYETDEDRRKRADARIAQQRQAAIDDETRKRQAEADARAAAQANKPGAPTLSPDGKGGTVAVQTMPDGSIKTTPLPNVPTDAKSITVGGIVYEKGPDGKYAPAAGIPLPGTQPGQAEPAGAPPLGATPQEIATGLQTYSTWLADQVRLYQSSGGKQGMAPDAATKAMESRIKVADAVVTQQNNTVTTQSNQRSQDITQRGNTLQDTSGRRTSAQAIYDNTLNQFLPMVAHAGKGNGGLVISAMQEALNNARDYVGSYGGLNESPEIGTTQFPALAQARQASMATLQQATNPPQQPFQPAPVTAPVPDVNAATAEAARQQQLALARQTEVNPPGAPPVSATPSTPAAVNPVSQQPITVPQTPANHEDFPPDYGGNTFAPPTSGEPGGPPLAPGPTLNPADAPFNDPNNPTPGQPVGMQQPAFMTQARVMSQGYDPSSIVQKLLNDPSTDNSALAQAFQQMYGRPLTPPQATQTPQMGLPLLV